MNFNKIIETSNYSYELKESIVLQQEFKVFKATNIQQNKMVMVIESKNISPERLKLLKRFEYISSDQLINVLDYCKNENELIIIMEWMDGTFNEIQQKIKGNTREVKLNFLLQIAKGLKLLHENKLSYQDLNPNTIAYIQQNDTFQLKLFIPGLIGFQNNLTQLQYKPPQHIMNFKDNYKCDIWAFGILCYELMSGKNLVYQPQVIQGYIENQIHQMACLNDIKLFIRQILTGEDIKNLEFKTIINQLEQVIGNCKKSQSIQFQPKKSYRILKVDQEQYILKEVIYQVSDVKVHLAENFQTKEEIVIKEYDQISENEVKVLKILKNQNMKSFIKIINYWSEGQKSYIAMEKAEGSLSQILDAGIQEIPIQIRMDWFRQIVQGVVELHQLGIIHRDLKPQNVLLKKDQNGIYQLKLCDTDASTLNGFDNKTFQVTQKYKAPEIPNGPYNEKVDIWSIGLIFYELLVDEYLIKKEFKIFKLNCKGNHSQILNAIENLLIEQPYKELLKGMLQINTEKRLSAQKVLQTLDSYVRLTLPNPQFFKYKIYLTNQEEQELDFSLQQIREKNENQLEQQTKEIQQKYQKQTSDTLNQKMIKEICMQSEIEKLKIKLQEQLQAQIQELQQTHQDNISQKLEENRLKTKKENLDNLNFFLKTKFEEEQRLIKEAQDQKKKATLENLILQIKLQIENQIEYLKNQQAEFNNNENSSIPEGQNILKRFEQDLRLLENQQQDFINQLQSINQLNFDDYESKLKEYESCFQSIQKQNQKQCQEISDQIDQYKQLQEVELKIQQDIEKQQIEQEQQQKLQNLNDQMKNKYNDAQMLYQSDCNEISSWQLKLIKCPYAVQEQKDQLQDIKLKNVICSCIFCDYNQKIGIVHNQIQDEIFSKTILSQKLDNVIMIIYKIKVGLVALNSSLLNQKQNYVNNLQIHQQNLLDECNIYLESVTLIDQYQGSMAFQNVKQYYEQTINEIENLKQQISLIQQLDFQPDQDDEDLISNEKILKNLNFVIQKTKQSILEQKNKFLTVLQEEKEALNVQQKCKIQYDSLISQTNFQQIIQLQFGYLMKLQSNLQQLNNQELNILINQKQFNLKQEEKNIQTLQRDLQITLLGDMIRTEQEFQRIIKDFNTKIDNLRKNLNLEDSAIKELDYRVQQTLTNSKSQMDSEANEIQHFFEEELNSKINKHQYNLKKLNDLNQLQKFDMLNDNGLQKQIQCLRAQLEKYENYKKDLEADVKLLQEEQNPQNATNFQPQERQKMQQLAKISNQINEYSDKLLKQIKNCELKQRDLINFGDQDIVQLQQKLKKQIEYEESQISVFRIKLSEFNNLINQYKQGVNANQVLQQLKTQEQQYKSSMILQQNLNYEEEWKQQIQRLFQIKQQYQLCKCYILLSNLFDLERLCKRRFDKITEKQQGDQSNIQQKEKRNKDIKEVQQIFKFIEENKIFLNQQEIMLKGKAIVDIDLIGEFQKIEQQLNQYQQSLENVIKQMNLVKLRGALKNQYQTKDIQQQFMPHFEGSRMKIIQYLNACYDQDYSIMRRQSQIN